MEVRMNIPKHVAIILDGNGRWAKKRMMPRQYGHARGAQVVEQICEDAYNMGIQYLTVYAFSTENWNRPDNEVKILMDIFSNYMVEKLEKVGQKNMKIRFIGERSRLDQGMIQKIEDLENSTKNNTGLNFTVALNYGSRDEMVRAMRKMAADVKEGKLEIEDITESKYTEYLDTAELPDPDLLIRTSGEQRLSNYLLWQLAYTEFYFTDVMWPDFDKEELAKAVDWYANRDRRFGKVK
ncbi:MAG: isoprenyl transferase [Lachnospiraceae bacterium]|nr:isoprenyl transferase [Lachnospiraceae bacterium]